MSPQEATTSNNEVRFSGHVLGRRSVRARRGGLFDVLIGRASLTVCYLYRRGKGVGPSKNGSSERRLNERNTGRPMAKLSIRPARVHAADINHSTVYLFPPRLTYLIPLINHPVIPDTPTRHIQEMVAQTADSDPTSITAYNLSPGRATSSKQRQHLFAQISDAT